MKFIELVKRFFHKFVSKKDTPPAGNQDTPPAGNQDTPPAGNQDAGTGGEGIDKNEKLTEPKNSSETEPGSTTFDPVPFKESLIEEIKNIIDEKLKQEIEHIEKLEKDIKNQYLNENQVKERISTTIKEELKDYINQDSLCQKLNDYVKNSSFNNEVISVISKKSVIENNKKVRTIEQELNTLSTNKVNNEDLRSELKKIEDEIREIREVYQSSEAGELQRKNKQLESDLENTKKERDEKDRELKTSSSTNKTLTIENDSLKKDKAEKEKTISNQKAKLKETQEELDKTNKDLRKANNEIDKQRQEIETSKKTISQKDDVIAEDKKAIEEKNNEIEEQYSQIKDLTITKENLEEDLLSQLKVNDKLVKTINDDNTSCKNDFLTPLSSIKEILNKRGYLLPCGNNQSDCDDIEDMLEVKVNKFFNNISSKLGECNIRESTTSFLTEQIEQELNNERSWIYDIARYSAYSRKRFTSDRNREYGVCLDKQKVMLLWDNLNKILSMLNFSLMMPDIFEDSTTDNEEYIDNTGLTISKLDFLVPNNDKYLMLVNNNDGSIIRDYAEIGYKYNGEIKKPTKIIR